LVGVAWRDNIPCFSGNQYEALYIEKNNNGLRVDEELVRQHASYENFAKKAIHENISITEENFDDKMVEWIRILRIGLLISP
jgi:hypothetical protein